MTNRTCHLPLVALDAHETCPRCGRPAREHRGHPTYEEKMMTETTEPTREQLIEAIDGLVHDTDAPQWMKDLEDDGTQAEWFTAVLRLALRTLDAEAQIAAMTERAEKAERSCDFWKGERDRYFNEKEKAERERDEERHLATVRGEMLSAYERRIAELSPTTVPTTDARLDCEASSLLLLSTWARRVMMREKNRAKGVPSESVEELISMALVELYEARSAVDFQDHTDDILAELGDAAACIAFAMREVESRRNR